MPSRSSANRAATDSQTTAESGKVMFKKPWQS